jgi:hypothetical protein
MTSLKAVLLRMAAFLSLFLWVAWIGFARSVWDVIDFAFLYNFLLFFVY